MKTAILNMLKEKLDNFISGSEISKTLNISRQAVSKHIQSLKEQGYNIESISRKGHKLISDESEIYNEIELLSENKAKTIGKNIIYLETVDSTNEYAKSIAFESNDRTVVIADEQTSGKGRLGRVWESEKGTGIWMSVILKPDIEPSEAPKITQIAAAAMTLAIEENIDKEVGIKWPNDIILDKKKVCGILTEMSAELGGISYVVVGIGVNVNQVKFSDDIKDKASSLKTFTKQDVSRKKIVLSFLKYFEELYDDFCNNLDLMMTVDICKSRSVLINSEVKLITKSSTRIVKAIDINSEGQLVVINENNELENIFYGEVSVRGLYDYVD